VLDSIGGEDAVTEQERLLAGDLGRQTLIGLFVCCVERNSSDCLAERASAQKPASAAIDTTAVAEPAPPADASAASNTRDDANERSEP
jgi:hypothetical protein